VTAPETTLRITGAEFGSDPGGVSGQLAEMLRVESDANCETCSWAGDSGHSRQYGWGIQAKIDLIHQMKTE
jgi:hypothetical protein